MGAASEQRSGSERSLTSDRVLSTGMEDTPSVIMLCLFSDVLSTIFAKIC